MLYKELFTMFVPTGGEITDGGTVTALMRLDENLPKTENGNFQRPGGSRTSRLCRNWHGYNAR